jgi:hypothetical protein
MVSQVQTVMANDAANGQFDVLGGFYWYQGESDAGQAHWAKEYQRNLDRFILDLRKDLPMSATAPVVLAKEDITATINYDLSQGIITPAYAAIWSTGNTEVRAADDWAVANLPDVVEVDTADLARNGPTGVFPGTDIHLTNVSELTLGQELATASEALLP